MSAPRLRSAARAIVLDSDERVLLVRFAFPDRTVWATPGGGLEPAETHEDAIRRELAEEAGLEVDEVGPPVWTRTHLWPDGLRWDGQEEVYFLVRVAPFEPVPRLSPEQLARELVAELRWWSQEELADSTASFAPRRLPELLRDLVQRGPGPAPVDVGV
ncbi:MAG TPA: NUDIX domain-containing protein [Gaiellaceae bacterium]|nr:NUDIX domain-containing protein [Gaiellaceae bacterium]